MALPISSAVKVRDSTLVSLRVLLSLIWIAFIINHLYFLKFSPPVFTGWVIGNRKGRGE